MDKTNTSFFKFVYKILIYILLMPIKIIKYFCMGLFYSFYVFIELLMYTVIFASFIIYKVLKYILLFFSFPVMIINTIRRHKENNSDAIVMIPDDADKYIHHDEIIDNNNDLNQPNNNVVENYDNLEVDENKEPYVNEIEQANINDFNDEDANVEIPIEDENKENIEEPIIEEENKTSIEEPIADDKKVIVNNLDVMKKDKPKSSIDVKKIFLPFQFISYIVYKIFKYFVFGLITILKYVMYGFVVLSFAVYKLFKYLLFSLGFIVMIYNIFARKNAANAKIKAKIKNENARKKLALQLQEKMLNQQKQEDKLREEIKRKQANEVKRKDSDGKISELPKKEKVDIFKLIATLPQKIIDSIKNSFQNSVFARDYRNKRDMSRQVLLINFEGEDAEKSDIKLVYQYTAKDPNGKIVTDYFEAFSKVEVHSFLLSEGYEVYNIKTNKWIQMFHKSASVSRTRIKNKDLIFFLTQLSTYIKSGIPLVEALKILTRQYSKNKSYQKLFRTIIYDLTMGENFSTALEKQKEAFPRILINMVKSAEMTGELPEVLDDMAEYFNDIEKTRKQMVTALMYPTIIMVFAIGVIIFILVYVIPQFVDIYNSMDSAQIPKFTLFILSVSNFLKHNYLYLILGISVVIIALVYLYKNVKMFRTMAQWLFMHMPIIGNVIIYNEVTIFTKTFSSLLSHNVFITDSMNILNKVTNNEIYKMIILDTITNLAKGEKISKSFENHWAFPIPAYEMLVTGEKTGQLPEMMKKVSDYYQDLHKNSVTRIKTFIEPILIVFLTVVVGAIVLAIVIPMFNLYQSVQNYS